MPDRFKNRFYKIERIGRKDDRLCYITNDDGWHNSSPRTTVPRVDGTLTWTGCLTKSNSRQNRNRGRLAPIAASHPRFFFLLNNIANPVIIKKILVLSGGALI